MTPPAPGRGALLLVAAAAVLCATSVLGYLALDDARDAAATAAADLAASRQAVARILAARGKAAAGAPAGKPIDLRRRIAEAAEAADIDADELGSINEMPPRKIGASAVQERPTQVLFRKVTLEQIITFLHAVTAKFPGLRVTSLTISAGPSLLKGGADTSDEWTADATLSYQEAAPAAPAGGGSPGRAGAGE